CARDTNYFGGGYYPSGLDSW
nr:immunoglobulin heavy chain junction region [Macaca mulatta]MOV41817.1 immunoglobulin heavy chain junction region [Macaca mulatta]MOV46895.1 immunoglobulin heavy chain junction region [Macaca mulatta]